MLTTLLVLNIVILTAVFYVLMMVMDVYDRAQFNFDDGEDLDYLEAIKPTARKPRKDKGKKRGSYKKKVS